MKNDDSEDIDIYLSGKKLIGNDYNSEQISKWYEEEKDAYPQLIKESDYIYSYHMLNKICGFDLILNDLPDNMTVCGFGSAYGDELDPIVDFCSSITLIDSSASFHSEKIGGHIKYIQANSSGIIDLPENHFDLITCFGVLHHIPNVSFVLSELHRCLKPNGILLVREPTTSMGDWRKRREGVTKNERGIPREIFSNFLLDLDFILLRKNACFFPPLTRLYAGLGLSIFRYKVPTILDCILCKIFSFNYSYHRTSFFKKLAPASEFYVCKKKKTLGQ